MANPSPKKNLPTDATGKPRKGGGRPPGAKNKIPQSIKEMVERALEAKGGDKYLQRCADDQPSAFLALVGKIIPVQVQSATELSGSITIGWKSPKEESK